MKHCYLILLIILLTAKALAMIAFIQYGPIGLGPDEAQYWTWSQQLDWGYYSKPPAIAWQIFTGTKLFGNTELGVRFVSVVLSALISLATYALALTAGAQKKTAFWAGAAIALAPLGVTASLFAITDVGMVFFWTLCCMVLVKGLKNHANSNYYVLGLLIALGALFKWLAYLFWPVAIIFISMYARITFRQLAVGISLSLIGLIPSLVWNVQHGWVTFKHVGATIVNDQDHGRGSNFFDFLGAQAGLLSPILFILFVIASLSFLKNRKNISRMQIPPGILFCGLSSFVILLLYSCAALVKKMQGNWCDFIYPPAAVALCWYGIEYTKQQRWVIAGVLLACILSVVGLSVPSLQARAIGNIPYKWSPFKYNVGWKNISKALLEAGYEPARDFLFGDKYQTTSILSFYGPEQKRAYFLNLQKMRYNQFAFWPGMKEEQLDANGYFILIDTGNTSETELKQHISFYEGALSQYFNAAKFVGIYPLFETNHRVFKKALIFKGEKYNGLIPVGTEKY